MYNPIETNVPSPKVSQKYTFIDSGRFVADMQANGLELRTSKGSSRSPYGKHVMRFGTGMTLPDGNNLEIVAKNSHDGTCAFQLSLGIYRLVCSNGLVIGKVLVEVVPIRHIGYATDKVNKAIETLMSQKNTVLEVVTKLQQTELTREQQVTFCKAALEIRGITNAVNAEETLINSFRRSEDKGSTAWKVFNRVQEQVTQGFIYVNTEHEIQRARRIFAVERDLNINKQLFDAIVKIAA